MLHFIPIFHKSMMNTLKLCITLFFVSSSYAAEYAIIFVHLGATIPSYAEIAIKQAQLFNPQADIYLITNQEAITKKKDLASGNITLVPCESLTLSNAHKRFLQRTKLDNRYRDGFWRKATERFFYLDELIARNNLQQVFHLEYDTMLYTDLHELLSIFKEYEHIAAVFDNDIRCIPCFMYIKNRDSLAPLIQFIADNAHLNKNDMEIIALYRKRFGARAINNLPIVMQEYAKDYPLKSSFGHRAVQPQNYYNKYEQFQSVFDGAALGQYVDGIDPRNGPSAPGFINESTVFNASHFTIEWKIDALNRKIPFITYKGKSVRINNLHIHSKKLERFKS